LNGRISRDRAIRPSIRRRYLRETFHPKSPLIQVRVDKNNTAEAGRAQVRASPPQLRIQYQ